MIANIPIPIPRRLKQVLKRLFISTFHANRLDSEISVKIFHMMTQNYKVDE